MGATKTFEMKKSSLAFSVLTAFALFACQKEVEVYVPERNDDAISFIVNEARPYVTKSLPDQPSSSYSAVIFSKDSMDIYLTVNESDYHSDFFSSAHFETKGVPYIDDNIGKFHVSAIFSDLQPFFTGLELDSNGSTVSSGYYWPLTIPATKLNFFGHAKNGTDGTVSSHNYVSTTSASFRYSLPADDDATDAVIQPDMLFAISPDQQQTGGPVQMDFYHALSALSFSVGSVPGNMKIEKVEFTNIYSSGTCTYTHQAQGLSFDWSFDETQDVQTEYTQTFAKDLFSEGNVPLPDGTAINTEQQTFMMIPQVMDDDAKIIFTISFNARTYRIERSLKTMTQSWLPGKLYTFRISSPEEVEVEVTDEVVMDGICPVKRNLQIKNTGLADSYIRVVIDGAWVVDDNTNGGEPVPVIVADWKPDVEGVYTWPDGAAGYDPANWIKSSDGYYYYLHVTHPGEVIAPLFDSYKLTAQAPVAGAYLEMDVLVQAVHYEDVKDFFPNHILTEMGLLP